MKQGRKAGLKDKYLSPALLLIMLFFGLFANGQAIYNPSTSGFFITTNKPLGLAQASPSDGRSMKLDSINGLFRPYNGTTEVLSYLPLSIPKYRTGNFIIVVDSGGSLQSNGTYIGGVNNFWMFKDGTANANLVELNFLGSSGCVGCLLAANNLSDLSNAGVARNNLGLGSMSLQNIAAGGTNLSGNWPDPLVVRFNGQLPSFYLNYLNLTNPPAIPPALNLTTLGLITQSGTFPNITITGQTPNFEQTLLKLNTTSQLDSINVGSFIFRIFGTSALGIPSGTTAQRPGSPIFGDTRANTDSTGSPLETWNGSAWVHPSGSGGGGGSGITALTGDVTASGTGSVAATLATVNSNVFGSNTFLKFAVNGKGLTTSATAVVSGDITGALGFTPYNATNPSGFIALTALSATSPLAYNNTTGVFSMPAAATAQNGYLTSTDWNTFNGKLSTALSSGNIFVGNASNIATGQTMTGDVGINNTGVSTIQANAVTTSKINANAVTYAKIQLATQQALLGAPAAGAYQEITLGTNLSITAGVLNASTAGAQTLVYTQNATNNNLAITGGNSQNFLPGTTNLAGLLDTARARYIDSARNRQILFNLFAANMLTAAGTDSFYLGGTANQSTTLATVGLPFSITGLPNKTTTGTDSLLIEDAAGKMWKSAIVTGGITQLTGDVTAGPGSGSQAATIAALAVTTGKLAANAVTLGKMSTNVSNSLLGYDGSGNPADVVLTNSGTTGPATLISGVLNIPNYPGAAFVSRNYLSDSIFQSASFRYRDTTLGIKYQFDYALAPVFVDSLHALTPITGYGYDSSNWVTIGTGSYLQTNSGYSVSGGKLVATGSSTYPNFIRLPFATKLDNWTGQLDYKITSLVTTDSGYKVRMVNTSGGTTAVLEAYLNTATGANFGKVALNSIQAGSASFEQYSSGAMATILANDSITVSLYYNFGVVIVTATDWTQLETVSTTYTNTYSSASGYAVTNTAQLTFNPGPSTYQVDHIKYSSNQPYRPSILVAGYSITDGFFAGSIAADAYRVIGGSINAGTGDQTAQLILRVPEIEAQKPVSVLIGGIAGNDVAASVSSGVWQANLLGIYDSLTAHGISVYFTLESPRNSVDITAVNTYIKATFPGRWIDIYTPLWSGSGTGLNAAYSFDGTHWNAAGHALVAAVIDTSAQYLAMAAADPNLGVVKYYGKPHYTGADSLTHITYGDLVSYVASHASGVTQGGSRTDGAMMMQSGLNRIIASPLIIDSTGTSPTMTFRTTAGFKFFTNFAGSGDIPAGSAYQASTTNDLCFFADATGGAAGKGVHLLSLQNGGVQSWAEKLNVASGLGVTRFNKDGGYSQFNVLSTAPNTDAIIQMGLGNLAPITNGTDTLGTFQHQFAGLYAGYGNFTAALGAGKTAVATSFLSLAAATVGASSMNIAVSSFPPTSPGQGDVWATSGHLFYRDGSTSFDLINPSTPTLQQILTAGSTLTGANTIAQANNPLTFSSGAIVVSGTITGSAGNNSSQLTLSPATLTDNSSSGTVASKCDACFFSPTFAASTSTTYTNAATLYINGPPGAGTNVTNTNSWALQVGGGNSLIQGNLYSSHYLDNSPTPGIAAGTGAGTTPTVSIIGTDQSGQITVTTGTAPTLSGVIATITYASGFSFRTGTYPILFPGNSAAALLSGASMVFTTGSQTNFTITAGTSALLGATSYVWYYKIGGN